MPSATVLHLLPVPPLATPPAPTVIISASTPTGGIVTTDLLDPAVPATGSVQVVREYKEQTGRASGTTFHFVHGRFLTRPLPAQTIGAGTWKLAAVIRESTTVAAGMTLNLGGALAQWRAGTGVVARLFDNTAFATALAGQVQQFDGAFSGSVVGSAATLLAGDCLVLELWSAWSIVSGTAIVDLSLLLGGFGQYYPAAFAIGSLTDTDAVLVAPAPITFS